MRSGHGITSRTTLIGRLGIGLDTDRYDWFSDRLTVAILTDAFLNETFAFESGISGEPPVLGMFRRILGEVPLIDIVCPNVCFIGDFLTIALKFKV